MGWEISLEENTVVVSRECALEIAKSRTNIGYCCSEEGGCEYDDGYNAVWSPEAEAEALEYLWDEETGLLQFDPDHMEHQDYVHEVADILQRHRVEGQIIWVSMTGDNRNTAWRYVFDGRGGMVRESRDLGDLWRKIFTP